MSVSLASLNAVDTAVDEGVQPAASPEEVLPHVEWPAVVFDCPLCGPSHRVYVWWSDTPDQVAFGLGPANQRTSGSSVIDFTFATEVSSSCGLSGTIQDGNWVPS